MKTFERTYSEKEYRFTTQKSGEKPQSIMKKKSKKFLHSMTKKEENIDIDYRFPTLA